MAWGDKIIARKFLRYAQSYVGWARFDEVQRPVPRTTAVRVSAPHWQQEVFLERHNWWIASPYDTETPFLNAPPRGLCPSSALEADVAIFMAHDYLVHLAGKLGSSNERLIPAEMQGLLQVENRWVAERKESFAHVLHYLKGIASGVGHLNPKTQTLAHELYWTAEPTLRENR